MEADEDSAKQNYNFMAEKKGFIRPSLEEEKEGRGGEGEEEKGVRGAGRLFVGKESNPQQHG